jgi:hypothetical protein
LPDLSWYNIPKREKNYQNGRKNTKGPQQIPNGDETYQIVVKYFKWPQPTNVVHSKALQNNPNLVILKIYYLATLVTR